MMSRQIGQFFLVISLILMVLFLATLQAGSPSLYLCFSFVVLFLLAGTLLFRNRPTPGPSQRFGLFRRTKNKKK
jgi:hypothetical protein